MILPSLNEGLPLVCAEAIRCGANVIGSDTGGISEVIGKENTVPLGDGFVAGMADKAVQMLDNPQRQKLPSELDWASTAAKELSIVKEILA
jgi:glycosyltransferase involved in cell wall biosynthesis